MFKHQLYHRLLKEDASNKKEKLKIKSNIIPKIQQHIFKCPDDGLIQKLKCLRLANKSIHPRNTLFFHICTFMYY